MKNKYYNKLIILLVFLTISCNDSTSPSVPENSTITIYTYYDENIIDSLSIIRSNLKLIRDEFNLKFEFITSFNNLNFELNKSLDNGFDLNLEFENDSFEEGDFELIKTTSEYRNSFISPVLGSRYQVESGKLTITGFVKVAETQYYSSGEANLVFEKKENDTHTTKIKIIFENLSTYVGRHYW